MNYCGHIDPRALEWLMPKALRSVWFCLVLDTCCHQDEEGSQQAHSEHRQSRTREERTETDFLQFILN